MPIQTSLHMSHLCCPHEHVQLRVSGRPPARCFAAALQAPCPQRPACPLCPAPQRRCAPAGSCPCAASPHRPAAPGSRPVRRQALLRQHTSLQIPLRSSRAIFNNSKSITSCMPAIHDDRPSRAMQRLLTVSSWRASPQSMQCKQSLFTASSRTKPCSAPAPGNSCPSKSLS